MTEDIGCAIILKQPIEKSEHTKFFSDLKKFLIEENQMMEYKVPVFMKIITEDRLNKTRTTKIKRIGYAETLGV